MLIYKQRNLLYYYVKKSIKEKKSTIIYSSFSSIILDFNKLKAWIVDIYFLLNLTKIV